MYAQDINLFAVVAAFFFFFSPDKQTVQNSSLIGNYTKVKLKCPFYCDVEC